MRKQVEEKEEKKVATLPNSMFSKVSFEVIAPEEISFLKLSLKMSFSFCEFKISFASSFFVSLWANSLVFESSFFVWWCKFDEKIKKQIKLF